MATPVLLAHARKALSVFASRDGRFLSAGIAFYGLLSAVPLAYIALWVASRFVSHEAAEAALQGELTRWVGPELAGAVLRWEERARHGHALGALSLVILVYSATRLFAALERGLNAMWELDAPEGGPREPGLVRQVRTRGAALVVATLLGVVLSGVVVLRAGVAAASRSGARLADLSRAMEWAGALGVATLVFFLLYTLLPRARARAGETLVGAALSAALFLLGSHAVTTYVVHKGDVGLGETLLVLLWLRYAAQVFLLGAAMVGVFLRARGALPEGKVSAPTAR